MILVIWMFSFKQDFSLSSFTFIKRLFSAGTVCISTFSLCPGYSLTCVKRDNHFMPEGKLLLAVWNHVISLKSKYMFPPTLQTVQLLLVFAIVVCVSSSACLTLHPHGLEPVRLFCPWDFPRQEYWSGLPYPPPGALHDLGSNLDLPHCRQILYLLSYQGRPLLQLLLINCAVGKKSFIFHIIT